MHKICLTLVQDLVHFWIHKGRVGSGLKATQKTPPGQLCTVEPVDAATLQVGNVVLCKVNGRQYLHLVKAVQGGRFQIGNNRERVNGWVSAGSIYSRCTRVE